MVRDKSFTTSAELDLYIWYGREKDPRLEQFPLYRDHLLPVAAPERAEELAGAPLEVLAQQRLIHLEGDDISWTKWHDWFRQLGYKGPVASGIRVNNYSIALQAAQDGAGADAGLGAADLSGAEPGRSAHHHSAYSGRAAEILPDLQTG